MCLEVNNGIRSSFRWSTSLTVTLWSDGSDLVCEANVMEETVWCSVSSKYSSARQENIQILRILADRDVVGVNEAPTAGLVELGITVRVMGFMTGGKVLLRATKHDAHVLFRIFPSLFSCGTIMGIYLTLNGTLSFLSHPLRVERVRLLYLMLLFKSVTQLRRRGARDDVLEAPEETDHSRR